MIQLSSDLFSSLCALIRLKKKMIDTRDGAGKAEKKPCAPARCELKEKKKERKKERKK